MVVSQIIRSSFFSSKETDPHQKSISAMLFDIKALKLYQKIVVKKKNLSFML